MTKRTILLRIDFLSELPEGVGSVIQDALQLALKLGGIDPHWAVRWHDPSKVPSPGLAFGNQGQVLLRQLYGPCSSSRS